MLKFIYRDTRNHSKESIAERRYHRMKGKSLKNILLDRFLNNYGYDKGIVTANAIVDNILNIIEQYSPIVCVKHRALICHSPAMSAEGSIPLLSIPWRMHCIVPGACWHRS